MNARGDLGARQRLVIAALLMMVLACGFWLARPPSSQFSTSTQPVRAGAAIDASDPPQELSQPLPRLVQPTPEHIAEALRNWPQWRGPLSTGVTPLADPPLEWSEGKNIKWKSPLPGKGHSTPVIWNDRIYLTAAIEYGDELPPRYSTAPGAHDGAPITHRFEFVVMALDRSSGATVWRETVHRALPHEGAHYSASLASSSPVTDGEFVYALFGSHGLYCLDPIGGVVWSRDFGPMNIKHGHGEGSSPVLYGEALFVNWDHEGQSFLIALDRYTGDTLWKVDRDEPTSWATPIIVTHAGREQLIVPGTNRTRGYDAATGEVIWECAGLSPNIVASPVAGDGVVYVGSSYTSRAVLAIRLQGAAGDISRTDRVAWQRVQGAPYVPSPLLYDESLYFLNHYQAILTRVHGPSGEDRPGPIRVPNLTDIYASPVAAAGRVYITDLAGTTVVMSHADEPKVLAVNVLDDVFAASAAIAGKELYLRGEHALYCIAEPSP